MEKVANEADGYLSADELWTPHCNLLRDMLGLSDIDPHQLLVIFLPALFESACFGIDMGLFNKQRFQIIILAFPAMILSSALTGLMVRAARLGRVAPGCPALRGPPPPQTQGGRRARRRVLAQWLRAALVVSLPPPNAALARVARAHRLLLPGRRCGRASRTGRSGSAG